MATDRSGQPGERLSLSPRGRLLAGLVAVSLVWSIAWTRWFLTDGVVPWDSKNQFYAFFRFLAESLHAGTSPFWNPYHYGGHPSIADPQSLIFSPLFYLWAWFDRSPTLLRFDLLVMLHLLVGAFAFVVMGWRRGWPVAASVLGATVFMLGGAASSRLNHTGIILCYGLFPVALLLLEIAMERRSIGFGLAFATVASMILLGRNQVGLMLCLALLCACALMVARSPAPFDYLRRRAGLLGVMALAGFALCFVPLLLTAQLADLSNRPVAELGEALNASLHPSNLVTLASPDAFGSHAPNFGYWGPHYTTVPDVAATDDSFNYLFVGAVPTLLLLWFGIAAGGLAERSQRAVAVALGVAGLFALGRYTPLFALIFDNLPGFSYFRRPVDATFLITIGIAFLAARLLARYASHGLPKLRPLPTAVLAAMLIATVCEAVRIATLTQNEWGTLKALGLAAFVCAAVGAVLVGMRHTPARRGMAAGCVALIAASELIWWNAASRLNSEHRRIYEILETAGTEDIEPLRILTAELARRHAEGARPRVEIIGLDGAWQNLAAVRKFEATTGYNPLRIGIYDRTVEPGEGNWIAGLRRFPATFSGYDCAIARSLGIEYVVLDRPMDQLKQMPRMPRTELVFGGPKVWIYRIPGALPRVKFSSRIEVADVDAKTLTGELISPPQADQVVIDDETPPTNHLWAAVAGEGGGSASIISWRPGRIEVAVKARRAGVLVLHDVYYPGWIAEVDGQRVPIMRTDVMFRGVEVSAGDHRIVFRFAPLRAENLIGAAKGLIWRKKQAEQTFELPPV